MIVVHVNRVEFMSKLKDLPCGDDETATPYFDIWGDVENIVDEAFILDLLTAVPDLKTISLCFVQYDISGVIDYIARHFSHSIKYFQTDSCQEDFMYSQSLHNLKLKCPGIVVE
jgi:hypothetical protein